MLIGVNFIRKNKKDTFLATVNDRHIDAIESIKVGEKYRVIALMIGGIWHDVDEETKTFINFLSGGID